MQDEKTIQIKKTPAQVHCVERKPPKRRNAATWRSHKENLGGTNKRNEKIHFMTVKRRESHELQKINQGKLQKISKEEKKNIPCQGRLKGKKMRKIKMEGGEKIPPKHKARKKKGKVN